MKRISVDPIDGIAVIGVTALVVGVGLRFGVDAALAVLGILLITYAVLATRHSEVQS